MRLDKNRFISRQKSKDIGLILRKNSKKKVILKCTKKSDS